MKCQIKSESLFFPTMYKYQKVTFPTCSGFCGSGSHMTSMPGSVYCSLPGSIHIMLCSGPMLDIMTSIIPGNAYCLPCSMCAHHCAQNKSHSELVYQKLRYILQKTQIDFCNIRVVVPVRIFGPNQNDQKRIDLTCSKSDYGEDHIAGWFTVGGLCCTFWWTI